MVPRMQVGLARASDAEAAPRSLAWPRSGLLQRLLAIGLAPALIILLTAAVVYVAMERSFAASSSLTQSRNTIGQIVLLQQAVIDQETAVRGYVLTGDPAFLQPYATGRAAFEDILATLRPMVAGDQATRDGVERVARQQELWRATIADAEIAAVATGDLEGAQALVATGNGKAITDDIRATTQRMVQADEATLTERRLARDAAGATAVATVVIGSLAAALVLFLVVLATSRRVARDVRAVATAATGLAEGDLSVRAPVRSDDEIGALAVAFNVMAARLEQALALEQAATADLRDRSLALAAVNEELESFSYSVSHDLRAPLRTIDGFSQILLEDHSGQMDPEAHRLLVRVRAASQRMATLIEDLLQLSGVARTPIERTEVDLSAVATTIVEGLRRSNPKRTVVVHIEPGLTTVADPGLVRIVLDNLIANAWKFTSRTSDATIFVERLDAADAFQVRDNGAGFDPGSRSRLFQPFQRLHADEDFPGTGIGLATVRRAVLRHGGSVAARGRPGQGATFSFSFSQRLPA